MPPTSSPTDEALAADYRSSGDQAVLGTLYARYLKLVFGLCLHYLHDGGRAEDASMDIYEQLVVKLRNHDVEQFRPWLYRLARNHCLMILRRKANQLSIGSTSVATVGDFDVADMHWGDIAHLSDVSDADASQDQEARLLALEACTEALGDQQAQCIRRFYLEGISYADIAEELSWTFNQVRSAIQNGRRNLKICVERKLQHAHR